MLHLIIGLQDSCIDSHIRCLFHSSGDPHLPWEDSSNHFQEYIHQRCIYIPWCNKWGRVVDYHLFLIHPLLLCVGCELHNYQLPLPVGDWTITAQPLQRQLDYHPPREQEAAGACSAQMNAQQVASMSMFCNALMMGQVVFNGSGGTGKTLYIRPLVMLYVIRARWSYVLHCINPPLMLHYPIGCGGYLLLQYT